MPTPPTITITPTAGVLSSFRLWNNSDSYRGFYFNYPLEKAKNQYVIIDTDAGTVKAYGTGFAATGTSMISKLEAGRFYELVPGDNVIAYQLDWTATAPPPYPATVATIKHEWTKRWT
jgi:hypothetical protein